MKAKKGSDTVEYMIELPRKNKYFFLIRKFMEDILSTEKISVKEKQELVLAVNETCDRIVRMDPSNEKNVKINLKIRVKPKKITVIIGHKGKTVLSNYFKTHDEEEVVLESVKNRIGDYLIDKSVDEVSFSSSKRKGQVIKIVKNRGKDK